MATKVFSVQRLVVVSMLFVGLILGWGTFGFQSKHVPKPFPPFMVSFQGHAESDNAKAEKAMAAAEKRRDELWNEAKQYRTVDTSCVWVAAGLAIAISIIAALGGQSANPNGGNPTEGLSKSRTRLVLVIAALSAGAGSIGKLAGGYADQKSSAGNAAHDGITKQVLVLQQPNVTTEAATQAIAELEKIAKGSP